MRISLSISIRELKRYEVKVQGNVCISLSISIRELKPTSNTISTRMV